MMTMRRLLFAAMLFLPFTLLANAAVADSSEVEGVKILIADFGLFNPTGGGKSFFTPSRTVPYAVGQNFGWTMLLRTNKPKIKLREELVLPEKPDTWGDPPPNGARTISEDGRVAITEQEVTPTRSMILNVWGIAPGDPKGRHLVKITVEGKLLRTFEFTVQ
ncbi:MAG TPA: hypothetical protein VFW68_01845 [Rhodocyclaceae bacterium]|nr:hypothetical protein [Rhodocyclaceae bacterium]